MSLNNYFSECERRRHSDLALKLQETERSLEAVKRCFSKLHEENVQLKAELRRLKGEEE